MRRTSGSVPEMNVTPLVDVVLVLLIIFMVITPQADNGPSVDLPRVRAGEEAQKLDPFVVTIGAESEIHWDKVRLNDWDELKNRFQTSHAEAPQRRFLFRIEKSVPYAVVRRVLQMAEASEIAVVDFQVGVDEGSSTKG